MRKISCLGTLTYPLPNFADESINSGNENVIKSQQEDANIVCVVISLNDSQEDIQVSVRMEKIFIACTGVDASFYDPMLFFPRTIPGSLRFGANMDDWHDEKQHQKMTTVVFCG